MVLTHRRGRVAQQKQLNERFRLTPFFTNYLYSERINVDHVSNSLIAAPEEALTELVNPSNNTGVAGFPETPGHIRTMQAATLNEVLKQLGLGVGGNRAAREQRLRTFIGLKRSSA
jgi:hypothetical protein